MKLNEHLSTFVEDHPEGWGHDEWTTLLQSLEQQGEEIADADSVGWALENLRLGLALRRAGVPGLGPKRIDRVVNRFGTLWSLRQASADQVAEIPTIHQGLAEQLVTAVRPSGV